MPSNNFIQTIKDFLRYNLTPAVRVLFVSNIAIFLFFRIAGAFTPDSLNPFDWFSCVAFKGYEKGGHVFLAIPSLSVSGGAVWQLVTYSFLHAGPWHLLGNMLFLWFFGPLVERRIGTTRFWRVYLIAAAIGGLSHVAYAFITGDPRPMVGASGAVMAITVICAFYYFDMMVYVWGIFPIKLGILCFILVGIDILYMIDGSGSTANYAHIAGAAYAVLYMKARWDWFDIWRWRFRALGRRLWPFHRRRKAQIKDIFNDDYFKR